MRNDGLPRHGGADLRRLLTEPGVDWDPHHLPTGFCHLAGHIYRRLPGGGEHCRERIGREMWVVGVGRSGSSASHELIRLQFLGPDHRQYNVWVSTRDLDDEKRLLALAKLGLDVTLENVSVVADLLRRMLRGMREILSPESVSPADVGYPVPVHVVSITPLLRPHQRRIHLTLPDAVRVRSAEAARLVEIVVPALAIDDRSCRPCICQGISEQLRDCAEALGHIADFVDDMNPANHPEDDGGEGGGEANRDPTSTVSTPLSAAVEHGSAEAGCPEVPPTAPPTAERQPAVRTPLLDSPHGRQESIDE